MVISKQLVSLENKLIIHLINRTMETLKDVYLSKEQFKKDLDDCLTIIKYPNRTRKYYVCEHISPALLRRKVKVFINR